MFFSVASVTPLSNIPQLPIPTVNVNRPFIFFIFNRVTKNVLFSGQVHDVKPVSLAQRISFMDTAQTNYYTSVPAYSKYQPQPLQVKNKQSTKH